MVTVPLLVNVVFDGTAQSGARRSSGVNITYEKRALKQLKKDSRKRFEVSYKEALKMAEEKNWDILRTLPGGGIIELHGIDSRGHPIYYKTYSLASASTTSTDKIWDGGAFGLSLSGSSEFVSDRLGIWDAGGVLRTHRELSGRVSQEDNTRNSFSDDHATHVAGIMIGGGVNAAAKGMAYQSDLRAWDWNNDISEMSAAAAEGLLLSNHSYGLGNIGWVYNPNRRGSTQWEWWGDTDVSDFEDYRFGYYDEYARDIDEISNNAPYYLALVAAGNDRTNSGPGAGNPYYLNSTNTTSTVERRDQDSFDLITSFGLAKNVLTVGAIHPLVNGFEEYTETEMAFFSSWGPVDDGRIKPDIVANGWEVISSVATSDQAYDSYSGTSMAAPNVTGSLQLLQEFHAELNDGNFLKAATLKGLVLHTSDDTGNDGPDYTSGWGVLNTARTAEAIYAQNDLYMVEERSLLQDIADTILVIASGSESLKVTISWNDPFALPLEINELVLNNRNPLLINDLDVRVTGQDSTFLPWVLNPDFPSAAAFTGDNFRDNIEQVLIDNPVPGTSYQVVVSHKNTLAGGFQDYSLIISGQGGQPYCASEPENQGGPGLGEIHFGSLEYLAGPCDEEAENPELTASVSYKQDGPIPLSMGIRSCDSSSGLHYIHAFIDWNKDFDFEDEGEIIASSELTGDNNLVSTVSLSKDVSPGSSTKMRIIVTDDPEVNPCGGYTNGETLDITVRFVSPQYDIALLGLVSPTETSCTNTIVPLQVRLKNEGSRDIGGIPIELLATAGSSQQVFRDTLQAILSPGEEEIFSLDQLMDLAPDTGYSFLVSTSPESDQYRSNDTIATSILTRSEVIPHNARAFICDAENIRLLSDESFTFWYTDENQQVPLGYGTSVVTDQWPVDTTFYAAINDLDITLGPKDKYEFEGGSYGAGYLPEPLISTGVPVVLDSARLYIGNSGKLIFHLVDQAGDVVSSSEIEVEATRDPAILGDSDDDLDDKGTMHHIGLEFPEPGNYRIRLEYREDASVFRSNEGVEGFPFAISDIITLHGALFEGDTLRNAYYYLYDMKIRSLGCSSNRIAIKPQTGPQVNNMITSQTISSCNTPIMLSALSYNNHVYEWTKDGVSIQTTSAPFFEADVSGDYGLILSNEQCVYSPSNTITLDITNLETPEIILEPDDQLISSITTGENQWYLDGELIVGAIDDSYEAVIAGYYQLEVSKGECVLYSEEKLVYVDPPFEEGIWVYPNPAEDIVTVRLRETSEDPDVSISLFDMAGNDLLKYPMTFLFEDIYEAKLDVSALRSGIYLLKAPKHSEDWVKKLFKR